MKNNANGKEHFFLDAMNPKAFGERVAFLAEEFGGTPNLARACGVSESIVRKWKSGQSEPSRENLIKLALNAGVSLEWLATGVGAPYMAEEAPGTYDACPDSTASHGHRMIGIDDEYALIPLYDVRAAAGHGSITDDEQVIDYLAFKQDWLRQQLHASPNHLYLIEVDGESMEPTLRPGDIILVDRRDAQDIPRDGIYVLRMDGGLLVKRLQRLPGRRVRVTSDNAAYESFELSLDNATDDLVIVGRVVWSGRRM